MNGYECLESNYHYILNNDIDLSEYLASSENGWEPIGTYYNRFDSKLNGNGHKVSGLWINTPYEGNVGLFGGVGVSGEIKDIIVEIDDTKGGIKGSSTVGGLVGYNEGIISNSQVTGNVSGEFSIGGLIGHNNGIISNSHATGSVTGDESVGGLTGRNTSDGSINSSHATGSVTGNEYVGGLVGENGGGTISNSYATGSVEGTNNVGGLVGINGDEWNYPSSKIYESYATGSVEGNYNVGGLVGINLDNCQINNSYATGSVSGEFGIGGLVGMNVSEINNSYATGSVSGEFGIGGLVGDDGNAGTTNYSYYDSEITELNDEGKGEGKTTADMKKKDTYIDWDFNNIWAITNTENNGYPILKWQPYKINLENANVSSIPSQTYTGSKIEPAFTVTLDGTLLTKDIDYIVSHYDNNINVGTAKITIDGIGNYLGSIEAYFEIIAKTITITGITASSKEYDGNTTADVAGIAAVNDVIDGDKVFVINGTASFANKNVGIGKTVTFVNFTLGGADAGNYELSAQPSGTANITAKPVTITGLTANNKVYDGNTNATFTGTAAVSGKISSDAVTITNGTAKFNDKNVGDNKTVIFTGFSISGTDAGNYTLSQPSGTANITTPKSVTITGVTVANKVYDGTDIATITGTTISGVIGSDNVTVINGNATFSSKRVNTGKQVTFTNFALDGKDAGNYTLSAQPTRITTGVITAKSVTITATANNKVYDGKTDATIGTSTINGKIDGDAVTVANGSASFDNANVGTDKTVTFTGFTLEGTDAGNYTLSAQPANAVANITPSSSSSSSAKSSSSVAPSSSSSSAKSSSSVAPSSSSSSAKSSSSVAPSSSSSSAKSSSSSSAKSSSSVAPSSSSSSAKSSSSVAPSSSSVAPSSSSSSAKSSSSIAPSSSSSVASSSSSAKSSSSVAPSSSSSVASSSSSAKSSSSSTAQPPPVVADKCGTSTINYEKQFCHNDKVYSLCNGSEYDPESERCSGGALQYKCGKSSWYNDEKQFCWEDEKGGKVYSLCGGSSYDPETEKCQSGAVVSKTTPILPPQVASLGNILVHTTTNTILLSNLPQGAKVEVYNIQGKLVFTSGKSSNLENRGSDNLRIGVQTGVYIVKINSQTLRIAVK